MEDDAENYTRFLVLGSEADISTEEAKTSIVFSTRNIPGALFKCLAVFALRDIDLTTIAHLRQKNAELAQAYEQLAEKYKALQEQQ